MRRSLQNKTVLVTREKSQAAKFSSLIKQASGNPIEVPLLSIRCREKNKQTRKKLSNFKWIFFTSAHGVHCFFNTFPNNEYNKNIEFATVGHKTETALKEYGYEATFIPSTYNADVMAKEFFELYPDANHILLVRGNLSRKLLVEEFTRRNLAFESIIVYDTFSYLEQKDTLLQVLKTSRIDFLTFTSPSTVRTFIELTKDLPFLDKIRTIPCVCIGTTTEKEALHYQFTTTIVPNMFTIEKMVESMIEFIYTEGS